jgi:hypothetical protein
MQLKTLSGFIALIMICSAMLSHAQTEKATLLLQGGEEIACKIKSVAHGYVYFEADTKSLTFKYGDFIEIEKVAAVRLGDGRALTLNEYLKTRGLGQTTEEPAASRPRRNDRPEIEPLLRNLPPPPSGPGMRLTSQLDDTAKTQPVIGLRLPDLPPPPPADAGMNYAELAGLLAEAGLVGKLLNEINSGVLMARVLTKNQKDLLNAIAQSPVWSARKSALREAQRVAAGEFKVLQQRQPDFLSNEFRFKPASNKHAFEEFVQFLHVQNAVAFQERWQQVVQVFGEDAATALRDILANYDDWYFLFGEALEKR